MKRTADHQAGWAPPAGPHRPLVAVPRSAARQAAGAVLTVLLALATAVLAPVMTAGAASAAVPPVPQNVSGMDLHDGTVVTDTAGGLHMLGTRYGCGFSWETNGTPWCGFGSAAGSAPGGPWAAPVLLFSPAAKISATGWAGDNGMTWAFMCGLGGQGCFNPRMVRAPGGTWLLWFNAPGDKGRHANPYWVMTCTGPAGPCGSPHKPAIYGCNTGGDFSIAVQGTTAWMICSGASRRIIMTRLGTGDRDGQNVVTAPLSPGAAEGTGIGILHTASGYEAIWSTPNCGYCTGPPLETAAAPGATHVFAAYATAPNLVGPWTYRGLKSPVACTGQTRSVFGAAGTSWVWMDHWNGTPREAGAPVAMIPLEMDPWSCA